MAKNAESPGAGIPGLSQNVVAGFTNLAAVTAFNAPRGKEENVDATV